MGRSIETRVRVHEIDHRAKTLDYVEHDEYPDDVNYSPLSSKAYKSLKDAKPGDLVEVVWDYDIEQPGYYYPIVQAKLITGSLEERVEVLERLVRELRGETHG